MSLFSKKNNNESELEELREALALQKARGELERGQPDRNFTEEEVAQHLANIRERKAAIEREKVLAEERKREQQDRDLGLLRFIREKIADGTFVVAIDGKRVGLDAFPPDSVDLTCPNCGGDMHTVGSLLRLYGSMIQGQPSVSLARLFTRPTTDGYIESGSACTILGSCPVCRNGGKTPDFVIVAVRVV